MNLLGYDGYRNIEPLFDSFLEIMNFWIVNMEECVLKVNKTFQVYMSNIFIEKI